MEINHKELARRLVVRGIKRYRERLILEEDLLSFEDKRKVLKEIDKIIADIKENRVQNLQDRLERYARLSDCNEEFEL